MTELEIKEIVEKAIVWSYTMGVREAARLSNVPKSIISENRIPPEELKRTGVGGFKEHAPLIHKQGTPGILTDDEKHRLVHHMYNMNIRDMSMNKEVVMHHILKVVKEVPRKRGSDAEKWANKWIKEGHVNQRWYHRFETWAIKEYPDLKKRKEDALDKTRADVTRGQINTLYDKLEEVCVMYPAIRHSPAHWWNTDETNLRPGGTKTTVLVWKHLRKAKTIANNIRFLITALCAVCADGTSMSPFFILPGEYAERDDGTLKTHGYWKTLQKTFEGTTFEKATRCQQKNAWCTIDIFMVWFKDVFLPATAHLRTPETPVVLILDGFEAHTDIDLRVLAANFNVVLVLLPPHSTHLLQPLDVNNMGPLKQHYGTALKIWRVSSPYKILTIAKLLELLCQPFSKAGVNHPSPWDAAFNPHNIRGGFKKTGASPPHPVAIPAERAPSTPLPSSLPHHDSVFNPAPPPPCPPRR